MYIRFISFCYCSVTCFELIARIIKRQVCFVHFELKMTKLLLLSGINLSRVLDCFGSPCNCADCRRWHSALQRWQMLISKRVNLDYFHSQKKCKLQLSGVISADKPFRAHPVCNDALMNCSFMASCRQRKITKQRTPGLLWRVFSFHD